VKHFDSSPAPVGAVDEPIRNDVKRFGEKKGEEPISPNRAGLFPEE
jgi:hypothetical protein